MLTMLDRVAALQRTILFGELERVDQEALAKRAVEHKLDRGQTCSWLAIPLPDSMS